MKHKPKAHSILHYIAFLTLLLILTTGTAWCDQPPRGPLPEKQQAIIEYMTEHHNELHREVRMLANGYEGITTTQNKELATQLKEHFAYMEKRLDSGAKVRCWDPAFAELVQYYDQITTEVEYLDDGIKVTVIGNTPEAVRVAHNHARIVTGFTEKGFEAVRQKHPPVFGNEKPTPISPRNRPNKPPFRR